jgi:hypothetical protein
MMTAGCEFLDVVPDDTAVLADAFIDENKARDFLLGCYKYQEFSAYNGTNQYNNVQYNSESMCSNEGMGDKDWDGAWFNYNQLQRGLDNASAPRFDYWLNSYQGIKQCYIFLDNIDAVSPNNVTAAQWETQKAEYKGEAWFLIAYYHWLLLKNYGPIVIIQGQTVEPQARLPFDQCVADIAAMYDKAIAGLPTTVEQSFYGRPPRAAAYAMKAKMLAYAASPNWLN